MPIRDGRGTGLAPRGIDEVRTGDGTVLYTAFEPPLVDDFEDGNIVEYSAQPSFFSATQPSGYSPQNGAYVLETTASGGERINSYPGDGLANYPERGEVFRYYLYNDGSHGSAWVVGWGIPNGESVFTGGYGFELRRDRSEASFRVGGSRTQTVPATVPANTWIRVEVVWDNGARGGQIGEQTVTVTNEDTGAQIVQITETDATRSEGGITFGTLGDPGNRAFDFFHIFDAAPPAPTVVLDDFETYPEGIQLSGNAPEWGTNGFGDLNVGNFTPLSGTQNVEKRGGGYDAVQSGTDAAVVANQTGTFPSYPYAPATLRCGFYTAVATGDFDLAFGVPSTEANFNNNCYRIRGGAGTPPFIRRTVNGSSVQLASMGTTLSANTHYDIAASFQATGSAVDLALRMWRWDGTGWVEHESEVLTTDPQNAFPNEGGIGLAMNDASAGEVRLDYLRYANEYRLNGPPGVTP